MLDDPRRAGRSYGQYCGVARGLDLVGERWTLLIVRDLLIGPKRYKDLLDGLPGIGTNLLAARLRDMEERGLIRRTVLPPPAGSTVYELTDLGQELEPVVMALGRFGARFLGPLQDSDRLLPSTLFVAMRARFRSDLARGLQETYEFHVDRHVFEVVVDDGACRTREGQAHAPDAVFTMEVRTLYAMLREGLSAEEAIANGRVEVKGDPKLLARWAQLFQLLQPTNGTVASAA